MLDLFQHNFGFVWEGSLMREYIKGEITTGDVGHDTLHLHNISDK